MDDQIRVCEDMDECLGFGGLGLFVGELRRVLMRGITYTGSSVFGADQVKGLRFMV